MTPAWEREGIRFYCGDSLACLKSLPDASVQCCVTSPPYWGLRDYGVDGQIGLESTPDAYVKRLVEVFREVRRVLRDDGTLWLNLGDSYCSTDKWGGGKNGNTGKHTVTESNEVPSWAVCERKPPIDGIKPKDLVGIPWRTAFALQADGWYLRSDIIWSKPNPMPESVTDRPTKAHEYLFLLAKSERYFYDAEAISEKSDHAGKDRNFGNDKKDGRYFGGKERSGNEVKGITVVVKENRNKRSVWTVPVYSYPESHFATFPPKLIEPCILAGCPAGGVVLDPFSGAGTTALVSWRHGRQSIGIELNPAYIDMAAKRIAHEMDGKPRVEVLANGTTVKQGSLFGE